MGKNQLKTVLVNDQEFSIMRFDFLEGTEVRIKLAKLILPALGQLTGEGLKAVSGDDGKVDVKKMSMNELIENIDPDILYKASKALSESANPIELRYLMEKLLSRVLYKNKPFLDQVEQLMFDEIIDYSTADKLVAEVVKAQGFFGSLLSKVLDMKQTN